MENLIDYYLHYFTIMILIIGFIMGIMQVFSILASYSAMSEFTYNNICVEEYGKQYHFDSFNTGTIVCEKESTGRFTVKKTVYLYAND